MQTHIGIKIQCEIYVGVFVVIDIYFFTLHRFHSFDQSSKLKYNIFVYSNKSQAAKQKNIQNNEINLVNMHLLRKKNSYCIEMISSKETTKKKTVYCIVVYK